MNRDQAAHNGMPKHEDMPEPSEQLHPLETVDFDAAFRQSEFATLRSVQGIYAPLVLQMEAFMARKSARFPGLPSSNLHYDVLVGKDDTIDFNDVFNREEFKESLSSVHAQVERAIDTSVMKKAAAASIINSGSSAKK